MWNASLCDFCGDCLARCRYVDYDRERASREIGLLAEGKEAEILSHCITCIACNSYCPTGADPADLIFTMQEKTGNSPIVGGYASIREEIARGLEGEGDPVQVIPGDPEKPALSFDGFEFDQFPQGTMESCLFEGMTMVRGPELMSLTGMVHLGGASFTSRYAAGVIKKLAELKKEIVYIHNEGYILAHKRAPELGIDVPFRYRHLFEHLIDYLGDHEDRITPLNRKVAYHANCAVRWLPEQEPWLDEIFELVGVDRPSRRYERENALCCSVPIITVNKEMAVEMQEKNVRDAVECGAEALVTICPVCDAVLRRPTSRFGLPKIFITDLCRMALGEIPWPANG